MRRGRVGMKRNLLNNWSTDNWEQRLSGEPPSENGFTSELERKVRERIRMQIPKRRWPVRTITATVSIAVLLGGGYWLRDDLKGMLGQQSAGSKVGMASVSDDISGTVKVGLFPHVNFDNIQRPFTIRYPAVNIEVVAVSDDTASPKAYLQWVDKERPDFLMLPIELYASMAAEGKLKPLDTLIKKSQFDVDGIHEPLIQLLRTVGGGELYALPAEMRTRALYVNRELFNRYQIPLPTGDLSLDDVLALAARFQGTEVHGLTMTNRTSPFELIRFIGQSEGLRPFALEADRVVPMIASEGWKKVWEQVSSGLTEGWIKQAEAFPTGQGYTMDEMLARDQFAQGKAAMSLGDTSLFALLTQKDGAKSDDDKQKLDWITVPYKIDPSATNQSEYLSSNYVYALTADSPNETAAWELLQYTASDTAAERAGRTGDYFRGLLNRPSAMEGLGVPEEKWRGMYGIQIDPANTAADLQRQTDRRYQLALQQLNRAGETEFAAYLEQGKSVDQALNDLQMKLSTGFAQIEKEGDTQ